MNLSLPADRFQLSMGLRVHGGAIDNHYDFIGTSVFLALLVAAHTTARETAWWSIGTTFVLRCAAVTFNWQTRAARPLFDQRAPHQP